MYKNGKIYDDIRSLEVSMKSCSIEKSTVKSSENQNRKDGRGEFNLM